VCVGLIATLAGQIAWAHEVRPAYLELRETAPETFQALWKVPGKGGLRLGLKVRLPDDAKVVVPLVTRSVDGAWVDRWTVRVPGGLAGKTVRIEGLNAVKTDVLVRLQWQDGRTHTAKLAPGSPSLQVPVAPSWTQTASAYTVIGVEHIILGPDHLLFVFALLLIVADVWTLLKTITSFTVAHSITLCLATFDLVNLPSGPVEAVIALSIVFMAREVLTLRAGGTTLTLRKPWLVAFAFGLVHGLGFAGALAELGLPQNAVPLALATFNLGVELGQVGFVAVVLGVIAAGRRFPRSLPPWLGKVPAYAIGTVATFWLFERTL
jgi:hydrogenase/urease accessory protein HupE